MRLVSSALNCLLAALFNTHALFIYYILSFVLLVIFMQDEYAQKTGLVSQALSFSDEQKKEVHLFLILCVVTALFLFI